jgi:glutamate racemase
VSASARPVIGVFDSGFGGLTVLRALLPRIAGAHYLYLGDTARLPYGAKSKATIARYAVESARFLEERGAEFLVIACNTASALALDEIRAAVHVPVVGVIEPGARGVSYAMLAPSPPRRRSPMCWCSPPRHGAVARLSHECDALGLHATEMACPLLVPLVEEGWTDHPVTRDVLRIYLADALKQCSPHAVLLGCTHYPLIAPAIARRCASWAARPGDRLGGGDGGCGEPALGAEPAASRFSRNLRVLRDRLRGEVPASGQPLPRPTHPEGGSARPRRLNSFILYTLTYAYLLKTEPDKYSYDDLLRDGETYGTASRTRRR